MSIRLSGLVSGMDTDSMIEELVAAYSTKKDNIYRDRKTLEYKQDAWKELNSKIYGFYTGTLSSMKLSSNYSLKTTSSSNENKASVTASTTAVNGTQELKIKQLAKTGYLTGAKIEVKKTTTDSDGNETVTTSAVTESTKLSALGISDSSIDVTIGGKTTTLKIKSSMTIKEFDAELSDLGLNVNFDETNGRFFISSKTGGAEADFSITGTDDAGNDTLSKLGLSTVSDANDMVEYAELFEKSKSTDGLTTDEKTALEALKAKYGEIYNSGAVKIDGQDAIIELNGAEFTSTSNTIQVNGLTIQAKALTGEDEIITITTDTDVDAIYDKIKSFFKEYNELMTEMYTKYNAASAGDYEPLTEEEEEELSETQIEKWEKILTTAALRRDSTLGTVMSSMRSTMMQSYEINGKTYSLSTFGIKTLAYFNAEDNEKANYHIDGDKDDDNTAANSDKLRAAIVSDPEGTVEFFSKIMQSLYSTLSDKMSKSTTTSSAFKIYNDKTMQTQYDAYTEKLEDWEDKIEDYRERYVKKFSNMETAMAKLQSQQSYLSSLFGS